MHFTWRSITAPLGLAPSPSVFLAAVAARTTKLRFGPLVYTLLLYEPLRLIKEIGMLDQIRNGRLEIGVGRGIVAFETAFFGLTHLDTPPRFEEALDLILHALQIERLTYEGKFWTYRNIPMEIPPVHRPHPPIWYGVGRPDHGEWTAARGMNIVANAEPEACRAIFESYRAAGGPADAKMGFSRHLVIADDMAEAERLAMLNGERAWPNSGVTMVPIPSAFPRTLRKPRPAASPSPARPSMWQRCWPVRLRPPRPTICSAASPSATCWKRRPGARLTSSSNALHRIFPGR